MVEPSSFLFYDLETTGLHPAFDQILQFAATRTDLELQPLPGEEYNVRVRLRPDVFPAVGALLTTGLSIYDLLDGTSEYDAAREIHRLVNTPGTISVGYNSLAFDDEFLRFTFYRNLLAPYDHQWKDGCRRMDLLPIVVMYSIFRPDALRWPRPDGLLSLQLERLNRLNDLAEGPAHDALADVKATVTLARHLQRRTRSWRSFTDGFWKQTANERRSMLPRAMEDEPFPCAVLVRPDFGERQAYQSPALYLGRSIPYTNQHLWLRLDRPDFTVLPTDLVGALPGSLLVVRQRKGDGCFVLPPGRAMLQRAQEERFHRNLGWLRRHRRALRQIVHYFTTFTYPKTKGVDVDAALYLNSFFRPEEMALFSLFHQASVGERVEILCRFERPWVRLLAERLLARNYGLGYLFAGYEAFTAGICGDEARAPLDWKGNRRRTPAAVLGEIDEARSAGDVDAAGLALVAGLEQYISRFVERSATG
ncbi:MAG: exonuclease domain-containing protein [Candidatus Promineifilaceae bacterium]|nr:exonuclease domain-containing protein [Candidatus Promineifilaceae bacterium]